MTSVCVLAGLLLAAPGGAQPAPGPESVLTREETEKRVRLDAAERLKQTEAEVRVVESEERTWPDAGLGCAARKGVLEPLPVPGYRIVVASGATRFTYHTDKAGRFVRCDKPRKPLGPISK